MSNTMTAELIEFVEKRNAETDALCDTAVERGEIIDTQFGREQLRCEILGARMPGHDEVNDTFWSKVDELGSAAALDWYHDLSIRSGYVRAEREPLNVRWEAPTRWGTLEMSINLAKPEKDPRDIAAALNAPKGEAPVEDSDQPIPQCQLCLENEGYAGRPASDPRGAHPARQNLRILEVQVAGEDWGLQYSPYAYYYQHCIAMSAEHRPMAVSRAAFQRLVALVDLFPHYFFGSNADLPIVGGSILTHDHFQGGLHRFPMNDAPVVEEFALANHPGVTAGIVKWPLSIIRLVGADAAEIIDAADGILAAWRAYSDESVGIVAFTGDTPHNTITPIVHREGNNYVIDLALRCNITTDEHPLGVFHPHEEYHHVKKENIGLIEVMGLAILPARLKDGLSSDEAQRQAELADIGRVFACVLENAGVFKWDEEGRAAIRRFVATLS